MTLRRAVATFVAILLALVGLHLFAVSGRTIYRGGPIVTLDPQNRVAEAIGIDGDRIAIVGSEADVVTWGGRWARVLDLRGHALVPGFVDAHSHFPGSGLFAVIEDLHAPPAGDVATIADVVERLRRRAAATSTDAWVVGMGYDDSLLVEGRHPTRQDLDRVSTERPVAAVHVSGHLAAVNTRGLAALGYDARTPDPPGGRLHRDATSGELDGVLEERAMDPVASRVFAPAPLDAYRILREGERRYLAAGVTTAQNGNATMEQIQSLAWASRLGLLSLRLVLWPSTDAADAVIDGHATFPSTREEWVRIGAVKLFADGSIQTYTAHLSAPYHIPPGSDADYRGYRRMERSELAARIERYHELGFQVAVHGNGDAAIDDILDAVEHAQTGHPRPDARSIVVHAQTARPDQLDRMQRLGVTPTFFVLHTYYWGDRRRDRFLGPERAARISPARSASRRGLRFSLHCDTPVVPMEPLRLVWSAVNRRSTSGATIGPEERIDVVTALRAVTIDAAWQAFQEGEKGSLEAGKLADFVVLSASPLEVPPERLDEIRVLETIIDGRQAYRAPESN